nr:50S ribosomal protein L24, chloroplastic [Ipomoea batatas]
MRCPTLSHSSSSRLLFCALIYLQLLNAKTPFVWIEDLKMAAMAALQSSFTSLSLSSTSFMGQRFSPPLCSPLLFGDAMQVKSTEKPFSVAARLKLWERKDCKPNSLPVLQKMHVKVGDTVKVIAGHDKGKIGEVSEIFKHNSKVVVKDINLKTKHVKSRTEGESGQIIKVVNWIFTSRVFSILSWKLILRSNVMLYSKEKQVTSRVGHKTLDNGKRVRYLTKTGEIIDSAENWKRVVKEKEKPKEVEAAAAAS